MSSKTNSNKQLKNNWYTQPDRSHLVQFYEDDRSLISNLNEYVSTGLACQTTCIVIASNAHINELNECLSQSLDVKAAQSNGRYITLDAEAALASFMKDGLPDRKLFQKHIGKLMHEVIDRHGKPVRAYGEMVAMLWKAGNREAVIQLEQLWNDLAEEYEFSLYCAYPDLHFILDHEARQEISQCHNLHAAGSSA